MHAALVRISHSASVGLHRRTVNFPRIRPCRLCATKRDSTHAHWTEEAKKSENCSPVHLGAVGARHLCRCHGEKPLLGIQWGHDESAIVPIAGTRHRAHIALRASVGRTGPDGRSPLRHLGRCAREGLSQTPRAYPSSRLLGEGRCREEQGQAATAASNDGLVNSDVDPPSEETSHTVCRSGRSRCERASTRSSDRRRRHPQRATSPCRTNRHCSRERHTWRRWRRSTGATTLLGPPRFSRFAGPRAPSCRRSA
jgi:hypothetical protein